MDRKELIVLDFIMYYATDCFVAVMLIAYFSLYTFDLRQSKGLPIPRFFAAARSSGKYYACMSWIALFFAAHFLFENDSIFLHCIGFAILVVSFGYMALYRGAIEVGGFKDCRRH